MNQDAFRALLDLLPQVFPTPDALRTWLVSAVPDGERIVNNLPNTHVAPAQYFFAAADILRRWGLLGVPEFWDPFEDAAPFALKRQVQDLRAKHGLPARVGGPTQRSTSDAPPTPPQRDEPRSPQKITVLLVSADPVDEVRLQVSREFKAIITKLKHGRYGDRFTLVQAPASSLDDLQTALLDNEPHVLHLCCHGLPDGSLKLSSATGETEVVSKRQLRDLLNAVPDRLRLVVVNACFSQELARDIPPTIDAAIGLDNAVKDTDAIAFAVAFYEGLAYGRTLETAYKLGLARLPDGVRALPHLFPSPDDDPNGSRQLKLVGP